MSWTVRFADEFDPEFAELSQSVQDELLAQAKVLEHFGPQAGRQRGTILPVTDQAGG